MSAIPASFTRVPTMLSRQMNLSQLNSTNLEMLRLNSQMSSLKRVNRPSDDPVASASLLVLNRSLAQNAQFSRNLTTGSGIMNTIDSALGELTDAINQASVIASEQVGITSDTQTRKQQASVIDSLIDKLFATTNRQYAGMSLFAGSETQSAAVESFGSGYRYTGDRRGLHLDLGADIDFPVTVTAELAVGQLSSRVEGVVDLDPVMTDDTRLDDLRGPMVGQELGVLTASINAGAPIQIDLSNAETMGDARTIIESALRQADPGLFPGAFGTGVTINNDRLQINIPGAQTVTFDNGPSGQTATALGVRATYDNATALNLAANSQLNPKVTERTALNELQLGTAIAPGDTIRLRTGVTFREITLDPTWTIEQLQTEVSKLDIGVRVEIDESDDSINFVNEVSGMKLAVEEVTGGTAATKLGVRSFAATTDLNLFNDGRGVEIVDGVIDPISGTALPADNNDFQITLSDGTNITVDLTPADTANVGTIIAKINADAGALVPATFEARLAADGSGIELVDNAGGGGVISVTSLNGYAAEDLGLLDGTMVGTNLVGSDRAQVRVDSLFSTLIELRDALLTDDVRGITFAGERLSEDLTRIVDARALVGGRSQRLEDSQTRLEERKTLDASMKSTLEDLDFFEATTRFASLETQLQAAMTVTARISNLSLLNFI
ncbi:MAG: flagellin [Planctomycetota bacterium]